MSNNNLIFGTWPLSGDFQRPFDLEKGNLLLNYAFEKGIINFDTAPNYGMGKAEELLGYFINNNKNKKFNISTKIGNSSKGIKSFNYEDILNELENSIKRLNQIPNKLLLHNPRLDKDELKILLDKLKVRLEGIDIGISLPRFCKYDENILSEFPFIQHDHNIFYKELKSNILNNSYEIQSRSIFASGLLTSKFLKKINNNENFEFNDFDNRSSWYKPPRSNNISTILKLIQHFLKINFPKESIEEVAFKYVRDSNPDKIVIGFSDISQIDKVLTWQKKGPLSNDLNNFLKLVSEAEISSW